MALKPLETKNIFTNDMSVVGEIINNDQCYTSVKQISSTITALNIADSCYLQVPETEKNFEIFESGSTSFSSTMLLSFSPWPILNTSDERISSSVIRCSSVVHTLSSNSKNSSADISILDGLISLKREGSRFNSLKASSSWVWVNSWLELLILTFLKLLTIVSVKTALYDETTKFIVPSIETFCKETFLFNALINFLTILFLKWFSKVLIAPWSIGWSAEVIFDSKRTS